MKEQSALALGLNRPFTYNLFRLSINALLSDVAIFFNDRNILRCVSLKAQSKYAKSGGKAMCVFSSFSNMTSES